MKRLIFYTLIFLIACIANVSAQTFVPTYGTPCINCAPVQYEKFAGAPAISNPKGIGGNSQTPWQFVIENPPTSQTDMNLPPEQQKSFISLKSSSSSQDKVRVTISGFVQGQKYTLNYAVLPLKTLTSAYGSSATVTVAATNGSIFGSRTTTLDGVNNKSWVFETVSFTAVSTTLVFTFSSSTANNNTGYVGFDIGAYAFNCILPTDQVILSKNVVTTRYACESISLITYINGSIPPKAVPIWKASSNPTSGGADITVAKANVSPYFAFFYAADMKCYNTTASTSSLKITKIEAQVALTRSSISNNCPENFVDLTTAVDPLNSTLDPFKEQIRWFKNNNHQGLPIDVSKATTPGDYYAFYYNFIENCYSTDLSTSKVTVTIKACCAAGTAQVGLSRSSAVNTCPEITVNLNNTKVTNQPPLTSVVWFSDAAHTVPVADPAKAGAGTYYAFFKDNTLGCFNTDLSTTKLTVSINACDAKVSLSLKVFLQGATTQSGGLTSMRTNLQSYFGPNSGLLPATDPYGSGVFNNDINNTQLSGQVVDWVKVEIRSAADPAIVHESQSLWLRPDGTVVNLLGQTPKFNPQQGAVQIAVKHRNHLAIIGLPLLSFKAGSINYDFTTSLSQAYNPGSPNNPTAPPQMVLTKGVWCMWAGEVDGNLGFDSTDSNNIFSSNEKETSEGYLKSDIDLNGGMDGTDVNLIFSSMLVQAFSLLATF